VSGSERQISRIFWSASSAVAMVLPFWSNHRSRSSDLDTATSATSCRRRTWSSPAAAAG